MKLSGNRLLAYLSLFLMSACAGPQREVLETRAPIKSAPTPKEEIGPMHPAVLPGATIDVAYGHSCAIGSDKRAYCWGINTRGILGDGTEITRPRPVSVKGVEDAKFVGVGGSFNCALLSDGRLSCWGREPWRKYGTSAEAAIVDTDLRFDQIAVSWGRLCGLTGDQELYCVGRHGLKAEGVERRPWDEGKTWEKISGASGIVQVLFVNSGGCALYSEGNVSCWKMPEVRATAGAELVPIKGLRDVHLLGLSVRGLPCAILGNGSSICWSDKFYRPGDLWKEEPIKFPQGGVQTMVREFAEGSADCARFSDGSFGCMGSNRNLGIGAGEPSYRSEPTIVPNFEVTSLIQMSGRRLCGKTSSGELECVEMRESDRPSPPVSEIASSERGRECYVDGQDVVCIGTNYDGSLGVAPFNEVQEIRHKDLGQVERFVTASNNACVLLKGREVVCWGVTGDLPFETDSTEEWVGPTRVNGIPPAVDIALGDRAVCVIDEKHKLHCEGGRFSRLMSAHSQRGVASIVASNDSGCLLTSEDDVYCWGLGALRPIGKNEPHSQRNVPRDLELPNTKKLVVGAKHACALDRQKRLTCWGDGERGQIGAGQLTANVQPTLVLEAVEQVLAAEDATCALKSSGETLCWGYAVPGSGPQKYDQMIRVEVP